MNWRPYWYKMSARQKKICIVGMAFSLVLMAVSPKLSSGKLEKLGRTDRRWSEVASAHFDMSEGKFMFFFIIFLISGWSIIIKIILRDLKRKKNRALVRKF